MPPFAPPPPPSPLESPQVQVIDNNHPDFRKQGVITAVINARPGAARPGADVKLVVQGLNLVRQRNNISGFNDESMYDVYLSEGIGRAPT